MDQPADRTVSPQPSLYADVSFWGMTATQFLGAFNDNLFKQLLLLLSVMVSISAGEETRDLQGIAMIVFALPFLFLSGFAGYVSDRFSKRNVILLAKVAEIVVMLLGMLAFAAYMTTGLFGALVVLFLMGLQSTFFGPAKYGILPEMLRSRDLPPANGMILMTTFLAIILGSYSAGRLKHNLVENSPLMESLSGVSQLWMISAVCVVIAILGTITAFSIRVVLPAKPGLRFSLSAVVVAPEVFQRMRQQPALLAALLASCMFWLVGGMVQMSVNALGLDQLRLNAEETSELVAVISIGILIGCLLAGIASQGRIRPRIIRIGCWGMITCLLLLSFPDVAALGFSGIGEMSSHGHLLGYTGSIPVLIALGFFAGMFAVPIQVYLQSLPPAGQKGRMIAAMNFANWIAIVLSGILFMICRWGFQQLDLPPCAIFAVTSALILPVALWYHPEDVALTT